MKINPLKAEKLMEMNVFMQKLQIKQKACYIEQNGSGGPIILWGMYPHRGNEIAHMWDCLMETVNDQDFLFCSFQDVYKRQGHRDAVEAGTLQRIYKPSRRSDGYAW